METSLVTKGILTCAMVSFAAGLELSVTRNERGHDDFAFVLVNEGRCQWYRHVAVGY